MVLLEYLVFQKQVDILISKNQALEIFTIIITYNSVMIQYYNIKYKHYNIKYKHTYLWFPRLEKLQ